MAISNYSIPSGVVKQMIGLLFKVPKDVWDGQAWWEDYKRAFYEATNVLFNNAFNYFRELFATNIQQTPEAIALAGAAFRVMLFDDPSLSKQSASFKVFLPDESGSNKVELQYNDPGLALIEVLSNVSVHYLPHSITDFFTYQPKNDLELRMYEIYMSAYPIVYFKPMQLAIENEVVEQMPTWMQKYISAVSKGFDASKPAAENEKFAFDVAKELASTALFVQGILTQIIDIIRGINDGTSGILIASAAKASKIIDENGVEHPFTEFALSGHTHSDLQTIVQPVANARYLTDGSNYYSASNFAQKEHTHPEYLQRSSITNADELIDNNGNRYTVKDFATSWHTHSEYLRQGEPAFAARAFTDGTRDYTPDDFALVNHTHTEYLNRADPAENTLALQGVGISSFALKTHEHPEYLKKTDADATYVPSTSNPSQVNNALGFVVRWF